MWTSGRRLVQAERIACAKALGQNRAQHADRTAKMRMGLDLEKWTIMSSPGNIITTPPPSPPGYQQPTKLLGLSLTILQGNLTSESKGWVCLTP